MPTPTPTPPNLVAAPQVSLPYQKYGFKETRGNVQPARVTRSLQPVWGNPSYASNVAFALSAPLQRLLAPAPAHVNTATNNSQLDVKGINDQLVYQPDPMLMFGSGALFNFGQLPDLPASVNLLSNPDLWVNKALDLSGNPVATPDPSTFIQPAAGPGFLGFGTVGSSGIYMLPYTAMTYTYQWTGTTPTTKMLAYQGGLLWLNSVSQLSFQLLDNVSTTGSTVKVFLSGNTTGTPDWTYTALGSNAPSNTGVLPLGDNNGQLTATYTSRALTPSDNPVIVITGDTCNIQIVPIYPRSAVSTIAALGSGYPFDGNIWDNYDVGFNKLVLGNVAAERTAGAVATNAYLPYMSDYVTTTPPQTISADGYPLANGYAITDGTADPGAHLAAGANIFCYPNDWVELGIAVNEEPNPTVTAYDPLQAFYAITGTYGMVYKSNNGAGTTAWAVKYNHPATAGALLAFGVQAGQQKGGIGGYYTVTVNVYLSGDTTKTPDWTTTLNASTQYDYYSSPALTAGQQPVIEVIDGLNDNFNGGPIYLLPDPTVMSATLVGPLPQIRLNSVMNSVLGLYSPPALLGDGPSGLSALFAGQSFMASGAHPNWLSWYFGTTLYYVPSYVNSSLTNAGGNNVPNLNGSFFHVGESDGGPTIDMSGNPLSVAKGNALIAFGVANGHFSAWSSDSQVVNSTQYVTEGWVTLGAVVTVFNYQYLNGGTPTKTWGTKLEFFVNGQFVGEAVTYSPTSGVGPNGIISGNWSSLFEGFANLPSYTSAGFQQLGGFLPTRFYMENLSITQRKGSFVAYNDYFVGQTPVGPGRTVAAPAPTPV